MQTDLENCFAFGRNPIEWATPLHSIAIHEVFDWRHSVFCFYLIIISEEVGLYVTCIVLQKNWDEFSTEKNLPGQFITGFLLDLSWMLFPIPGFPFFPFFPCTFWLNSWKKVFNQLSTFIWWKLDNKTARLSVTHRRLDRRQTHGQTDRPFWKMLLASKCQQKKQ